MLDLGTSGTFLGSHRGPNIAQDSSVTNVINKNITSDDITHGSIQHSDIAMKIFNDQIDKHIKGCR